MSRFEYEILYLFECDIYNDSYEFKGKILNDSHVNNEGYYPMTLIEALNLLGEQGWELCDKLKGEGYIMKRKIIDI